MWLNLSLLIGVLLVVSDETSAHRILGVFPLGMPSHYFLGNSLLKGLAEAGHDVTIVTVFHEKNPPNGTYREIFLDGVYETQRDSDIFKAVLSVKKTQTNFIPFLWIYQMNTLGYFVCEETLKHQKMQDLIKSNEKFDVFITSQFLIESLKGLAPHFNAHQVIFNNVMANSWMNHLVGNPSLPSFHPEIMLGFPPKMSFYQRMHNTFYKFVQTLNYHMFYYPTHNELVQKYISEDISLYDVLYNVSLVLSNSHPSLTVIQPSVPVIKEIGGFHVSPPKALTGDLKSYLDGAENGVIYFSLGSYLKSEDLSADTRAALLNAFAKRRERVIWKWDDAVLPGQPSNVKVAKWLPQSDILAHPNIKLFITHGGYLSRTETVYHGVPVIALPILGDQRMNAKAAVNDGYGIALDISNLTEAALSAAIEEILSNPKYIDNVKLRSRIMRDRKQTPIEEAAYWIDYIVKYNGAEHLRVPYLELTWYQFYLFDVGLVILGAILVPIYILRKL
ncbi:unnamed protein product [Phaedon cochleariae]|uniref:UDP-glucuronosyltransferase n=1 Tax=Phaedon cochleariae TaxID=80249 RepID=A0A9P0GLG4_PHACE|nr:unnamed protein product [Phaedon cochleariae]